MILKRNKHIKNKRITVGDIGIAYLIKEATSTDASAKAQRPPIVFLHGFPFNKNMWFDQLNALPDHLTGIAVDIRGHGHSTMGHGFFSVDLFAKDLIEFLRKMGIPKAIVCGVSMGGYIALRAHELAPEKFAGMILSDTNAISDDNEAKAKRFETIRSVLQHGNRTFAISFAQRVFSEYSQQYNPAAIELIKSSIRRNNVRSICATLLALAARTDTTHHLSEIQVPTLLVWGEQDRVTPKEQAEILIQQIPDAEYVELAQCGHLPNLEDTIGFNKAMLDFLKKAIQ